MPMMSRRAVLGFAAAFGLASPLAAQAKSAGELIYIGMNGTKIRAARFDAKSGDLTAIGPVADNIRPTWAVRHPSLPILYFNEDHGNSGSSVIQVLRIDPQSGALTKVNEMVSGGGSTQMVLDWPSRTLLVANYGDGTLVALPILPDGSLGAIVSKAAFTGSGPHRRQASSHAHGVALDPKGRFALVTDLGADRIWVLPFDRKTRQIGADNPAQSRHMIMPPGSGPRHLLFHPNGRWLYAVEELTGNVVSFAWNAKAGRLSKLQTLSTDDPTFTGDRSAAEVAVSRDGRFVYTSNRGDHALVVHAVDPKNGTLTQIQRIPSGGPSPWHFAIHSSGNWLIVANRDADMLNLFRIDKQSGKLSNSGKKLASPKPIFVGFTGIGR